MEAAYIAQGHRLVGNAFLANILDEMLQNDGPLSDLTVNVELSTVACAKLDLLQTRGRHCC